MDYHINHSDFDCEDISLNSDKFFTYKKYELIYLDLARNIIKTL